MPRMLSVLHLFIYLSVSLPIYLLELFILSSYTHTVATAWSYADLVLTYQLVFTILVRL